MLDVNGFEVHDLGVDVPVETFVEAVKADQPSVVALSGFLTLSYDSMKDTVAALKAAGLRDDVKIMVGGGTVDEQVRIYRRRRRLRARTPWPRSNLAKSWVGGEVR